MSDSINMVKLVQELPSRSRGKACIVLTQKYAGQKKWAAELAQQTGADHINLLETFAQDESLSGSVGKFLIPDLFELLKGHNEAPVLIVSGMEFLKATWTGQANVVEQFLSRMETWNDKPSLLFVIQYDKVIATREFQRFPQYTFVVDQKETLAL